MKYTEEVKREAEAVVNTYSFLTDHFGNFDVLCAIQDRQSVLEELNNRLPTPDCNCDIKIEMRIDEITQQINYLKSKL